MFTVGCDPELFLVNKDGSPLSAYGAVAGTKSEPLKVPCGAVQVDGMALEFNTDPVSLGGNFNAFNGNINTVLKKLKESIKTVDGFKTAKFNIVPVQDFGEEIMAATPDEAKELGCDPDFCAYTKEANPRPDGEVTFRTASGHIHVGWGADIPVDHPDHIEICANFVKMMDAHVGLFMTIIDTDPRRRTLYGKAGAFRPKPYGVEYRTPSNQWLTSVPRRRMIYELTNIATQTMKSYGSNPERLFNTYDGTIRFASAEAFYAEVRRIIDGGDVDKAYTLLNRRLEQMWIGGTALRRNLTLEYAKVKGNA